MFERYTEKARRIIFFARYEASQLGSPYIETEHLLLGLLREDQALTSRFLKQTPVESIRRQIEAAATPGREKVPTSVDLPLSNECKRVLAYAAEEAERLSHKHIGSEHLLLGLLREEKSFAAEILRQSGVTLKSAREQIKELPAHEPGAGKAGADTASLLSQFSTNLSQHALDALLRPFVGREKEMENLMRVLGRSTKNKAALVGQPGVGKRSMVEGLAQRIAEGTVPSFLADKTIVALDIGQIVGGYRWQKAELVAQIMRRLSPEGLLPRITDELLATGETVFFMDDLFLLLATPPAVGAVDASELLKPLLLGGKIQCIITATPEDWDKAREKHRWLDRCFRKIEVAPMSEAEAEAVLLSAKGRLENFHSVTYAEDVVHLAVHYSNVYINDRHLPDKALDLMDEAAAQVKTCRAQLPEEILEVHKRIRFIVSRMQGAIANKELEKARFYSDEERKERDNLRELIEKHHIGETAPSEVTREDVEEVLSRWTGVPVSTIRQARSGAGPEASKQ